MAIDVKEYRKRTQKEVTVPSGSVFVIKGLPPIDILSMFEDFGVDMNDKKAVSEYFTKHPGDVMKRILPAGIVLPPVELKGSDKALGLNEIILGDSMQLMIDIMELSGLSAEAGKELDKFRKKRTSR